MYTTDTNADVIERCLRCVPHDEDTGGFFVATLRKVDKPPKADADSSSIGGGVVNEAKEEATADMEAAANACIDATAEADAEAEAAAAAAAADDGDAGENGGEAGGEGDEKQEGQGGKQAFNPQKGLVDFKPFNLSSYEKVRQRENPKTA
jgi:membrane protein involved in colicin uptake